MNSLRNYFRQLLSKSQHVQALGKYIGMGSVGVVLLLLATICALAALLVSTSFLPLGGWGCVCFLIFGTLAFFTGKWGWESFRYAEKIELDLPLAHNFVDTLSAEESLVRASEEPIQEQQAILLRAATDNCETPAEELVRPAEEQQTQENGVLR